MIKRLLVFLLMITIAAPLHAYNLEPELNSIRPVAPDNRVDELGEFIEQEAKKYNVDPLALTTLLWMESTLRLRQPEVERRLDKRLAKRLNGGVLPKNFQPDCGYFQMKPRIFKKEMGYSTTCSGLTYSIRAATAAAAKHFSNLKEEFGFFAAIGVYNGGVRYGQVNVPYVREFLNKYCKLKRIEGKGWKKCTPDARK